MTQDLIERLEKAEAGSRELDGLLAVKFGLRFDPPRFTTSLDDALALVERVLPGWGLAQLWRWRDGKWAARLEGLTATSVHRFDDRPGSLGVYPNAESGFQKSAPLALCIALLRAHREGEGRA